MYFTVEHRGDGFGAQFQTMIYCILMAETEGNEYVHTPIKKMEHNYDEDVNFIENVENLMNLKNNYKINDSTIDNVTTMGIRDLINNFESKIDYYLESDSLKNIKNNFWKNKDRRFFKNNKINIAIHIRRPNQDDNRILGADTSLDYYFNIIDKIKKQYSEEKKMLRNRQTRRKTNWLKNRKIKKLLFHIYSQNNIDDYKDFDKTDIVFHLNENLFDTFTGLVAADTLVTSASSLSYVAAILSEGLIYYQPFWHLPGGKWTLCQHVETPVL